MFSEMEKAKFALCLSFMHLRLALVFGINDKAPRARNSSQNFVAAFE